jgi:pimeloyl-ACP methyl ester carboxylesterase
MIHGPATGAWIWDLWRRQLTDCGWQANVLDLRGHGRSMPIDLATVTLEDYVADLASVTVQIEAAYGVHPILAGWSTGALIAMMYAAQHRQTPGLLLMSPVAPVEVAGRAPIEVVREAGGDLLGPATFGVFPKDRQKTRESLPELTEDELDLLLQRIAGEQESGIAYRQALRGVSVEAGAIECPSLILQPEADAEAGQALASYLKGEAEIVPREGHWGIVCHGQAVTAMTPVVDAWLHSIEAGNRIP